VKRAVLLLALLLPVTAQGQGGLDLVVHQAPRGPATLAMRAPSAGRESSLRVAAGSTSGPSGSAPSAAQSRTIYQTIPSDLADLSQRLVFDLRLSYGVEQLGLGRYSASGQKYDTGLAMVGDTVLGTQGLGLATLSTYASARVADRAYLDGLETHDTTSERFPALVRSAYAQMTGLGPSWLEPLSVRGGRQYHHGFALLSFDGVSARYHTQTLDAAILLGRPVLLYEPASTDTPIVGSELRIKKRALFALLRAFHLNDEGHVQARSTYDLSPRVTLAADTRFRAGKLARLGGSMDVRWSSVTHLTWELLEQTGQDWTYFPSDPDRSRLRLGPTLARLRTSLQLGTVFFGNLDALGRLIAAYEHGAGQSSLQPSYVEVDVAVDAHLSRGFLINGEFQGRISDRHSQDDLPVPGLAESLTDTGAYGEETLRTFALGMRFSLGPRRMSLDAHGVAEVVRGDAPLDDTRDIKTDVRAGVRVRLDGWMGPRLRVLGEYEVASVPRTTGFSGVQVLRVIGEASF
jgi:hypothetical protein